MKSISLDTVDSGSQKVYGIQIYSISYLHSITKDRYMLMYNLFTRCTFHKLNLSYSLRQVYRSQSPPLAAIFCCLLLLLQFDW